MAEGTPPKSGQSPKQERLISELRKHLSPGTSISVLTAEDVRNISCDKCGHISCVCAYKQEHAEDCQFRRAATCPVGIECEHGYDVCPICDPCTCGAGARIC